ncbi:MAG: hypothetical protein RIE08_18310 [Acidimicrobiales bacterium]
MWQVADRHTGADRFSFLRMRPMTLFDSGHSSGTTSLSALLEGGAARSADPRISIRDLTERIVVGGWPAQHGRPIRDASLAALDYLRQVQQVDITCVGEGDGTRPGSDRFCGPRRATWPPR